MIIEPLQMILTAAFPDTTPASGFTNEQIAATEARLGVSLPEALRDYFAVVGGSRDLMDAIYPILSPDKLHMDGDHLIFSADKDQDLEDFGIPLDQLRRPIEQPNPSVAVRSKGETKWFGQASAISAFLLGMASWKAARSLPQKARCHLPSKHLKPLLAFFEPVGEPDVRLGGHLFGLVDRKNAIVAAYFRDTETLLVGSARDTALDELKEKSGLKLESLEIQAPAHQVGIGAGAGAGGIGVDRIVEPLLTIVTTAFPGIKLAPGFTDEQMAATEARLGVSLPAALTDYFAVAGGSRDLMDVNYRMLPLDKLRVDGDHLIFCEENQGLEDFGILLEELRKPTEWPNPSVGVRRKKARRWMLEASSLSAFLVGMAAWQAVLSMPETARCDLPRKRLEKKLASFEPVGAQDEQLCGPRCALVDRKNAIVAAYLYNTEQLYVGSVHDTAFDELEERSGLDLESL
jgi:hypothetical protein